MARPWGLRLRSNFGRGGGDETPLQGSGCCRAVDPGQRSPAGSLAPGYDASALQAGFPGHANLPMDNAAAVPNAESMIFSEMLRRRGPIQYIVDQIPAIPERRDVPAAKILVRWQWHDPDFAVPMRLVASAGGCKP